MGKETGKKSKKKKQKKKNIRKRLMGNFTAHRDDLMTEISPREKSFSLVSGPPSPSIYLIHTTSGQKKKKKNVKKKRQNKGIVEGKREGKQCLKNCMITSEESEGRQRKTAKKSAGDFKVRC